MGREIEKLAEFVAQTRWQDVPEPVREHTKPVFLDTLGVILAGAERPEVRQLLERLAGTAGTGALLNGFAARSIELCEGLRMVSGQAAMQILPGVLAVAEHARSSGREMLAALLLGYDVAGRLAGGFTRGRWHIRMARCRYWPPPPREPACGVLTPPGSAAP